MAVQPLIFKIDVRAWVYNYQEDGLVTEITDINYPRLRIYTVSALTSVGTTATATMSISHGLSIGDQVIIGGATQTEYNGTYRVDTVPAVDQITYIFAGSATTPATGTILAYDQRSTVPGIVPLDGAWYVMTPTGTIYGSSIEDPFTWTALNVISAETAPDDGVALAKYNYYVVAFGAWTTEFFYNAETAAPVSPLARAENMFLQTGCAAARSVAMADNSLIWMAQSKEGAAAYSSGRSIVQLTGTQVRAISTPAIDRILAADDLATVHSIAFKHGGHSFYALTLATSGVTLVYDLTSGAWMPWTSRTIQSPKTITSLTYDATTGRATATVAAHGYADGDPITVAGATQTDYNVTKNITYLTADTFSYEVSNAPVTPATGSPTATGYTAGYFKMVYHTTNSTSNCFTDATSGRLYYLSEAAYDDAGAYIDMLVRTANIDAHTNEYKQLERAEVIGDKVAGNVYVRYSKDDYQTFSNYRRINLALDRCQLTRIGRARRVAFDLRTTDAIPVRLERMDVTI